MSFREIFVGGSGDGGGSSGAAAAAAAAVARFRLRWYRTREIEERRLKVGYVNSDSAGEGILIGRAAAYSSSAEEPAAAAP